MLGSDRIRPWRFEAHWMRRSDYENVIRDSWQRHGEEEDYLDRLFTRVAGCQLGLRQMIRGDEASPHKCISTLCECIDILMKGVLTNHAKEELASLCSELEV